LKDYGFRDPLTRSGLSGPSNIAEGFARGGDRQVAQFLSSAKASAGELRTQVYMGIEAGYLPKEQTMLWVEKTRQMGRIVGALIKKHRSR